MCGVAGIYAYHYAANPVDRDELLRIRDHMRKRGPDAAGEWYSPDSRVALGHRRLAIIDLDPRSNQPMASDDGSVVISFNGEIYNYRALRQELEAQGCRFRTQSDTEVLLHLYLTRGENMFAALRGMYAFALWDERKRGMLLARDPYGIKPLYYADDGWTCRVASQVKALVAGGKVSKAQEPAGVVGFYLLGSVPEPYTLYQEIRAVPAGAFVWVDSIGAHAPRQHFSIAKVWADAVASPRSSVASPRLRGEAARSAGEGEIAAALLDSVRHHLVADVPVGSFLSSGVDSGALVGLMRDAGQREIKTVTVGFDEFQGRTEDETVLAAETSRAYGTDHRVYRVTRDEFIADLPRILDAMDQPSIDGINSWFVSKATAENGLKVAISGLGGDELFGGYSSFQDVPRWVRTARLPSRVPGAGLAFRKLASIFLRDANPKAPGLIEYAGTFPGAWFLKRGLFMPWELESVLHPDVVRSGMERLQLQSLLDVPFEPDPGSDFGRVSTLESSFYMRNQLLRDTDWASMAHSLEVRVPLVDPVLLEEVAQHAVAGRVHDKAALIASPAKPLPECIVRHAKTGFMVPVAEWLQQHPDVDQWREIPALAASNCPWARRWAHVIALRSSTAAT